MLSEEKISDLEAQITEEKKTVDFDTREFTIEFLVKKYLEKIEDEENDIFVPDYQRDFVWDESRQSRLIESIILGLPIPIIFVAEDKSGRLEIVDGSQRIRTLAAFVTNELRLEDLERITLLNGLTYGDLPESRKRKINNTPIRMIVLSESATEDVRNDLFERINRGSDLLRNMEKRKGIYRGEFTKFIYELCKNNKKLEMLCPLANSVKNRQEIEELVLRFFALSDQYPRFKTHMRGIGSMLDEYMEDKNKSITESEKIDKSKKLENVLEFVEKNFEFGFAKKRGHFVSRVYFEALSLGVLLAIKENPSIKKVKINVRDWLKDENFLPLISGKYKTHTPDKIRQRTDYVKSKLIEASKTA